MLRQRCRQALRSTERVPDVVHGRLDDVSMLPGVRRPVGRCGLSLTRQIFESTREPSWFETVAPMKRGDRKFGGQIGSIVDQAGGLQRIDLSVPEHGGVTLESGVAKPLGQFAVEP